MSITIYDPQWQDIIVLSSDPGGIVFRADLTNGSYCRHFMYCEAPTIYISYSSPTHIVIQTWSSSFSAFLQMKGWRRVGFLSNDPDPQSILLPQ